jgi:hypothetical protein
MRLEQGTEVRVDIPDRTDPDFERYHRRCGTIVATVKDDASELTGDDRDNVLYRVEFDNGERQDFRWRDLRPVTG